MIDPECINEIKLLKREYELNPDNVLTAMKYSNKLLFLARKIYDRENSGRMEFAAYRTLLKPLTDVYQKHSDIETIAVGYLCGIGYIPEYLGDNVSREMMKIVNQFPNNDHAKSFCEAGLFFLVTSHVERKDANRAERDVKFLETLHYHNPTNETIAATYALTLQCIATIQDFFKGRKTAAKLKELVKQYPYNGKIITAYENVKNTFKAGNFFVLLDNKNKYASPQKKKRKHSDTAENSILEAISELFSDTDPIHDDMFDYNDEDKNTDYDVFSDNDNFDISTDDGDYDNDADICDDTYDYSDDDD